MPDSTETLLIQIRDALTRVQLPQAQELLDQFEGVTSNASQKLRARILSHALTVRRESIP